MEIYNDMKLINQCTKTYNLIQNTKPDRNSKGVETWFKYEDGNFIFENR